MATMNMNEEMNLHDNRNKWNKSEWCSINKVKQEEWEFIIIFHTATVRYFTLPTFWYKYLKACKILACVFMLFRSNYSTLAMRSMTKQKIGGPLTMPAVEELSKHQPFCQMSLLGTICTWATNLHHSCSIFIHKMGSQNNTQFYRGAIVKFSLWWRS